MNSSKNTFHLSALSIFGYFTSAFWGATFWGCVLWFAGYLLIGNPAKEPQAPMEVLVLSLSFGLYAFVFSIFHALPAYIFGYLVTLALYRRGIAHLWVWMMAGTSVAALVNFAIVDWVRELFYLYIVCGLFGGYFTRYQLLKEVHYTRT